MTIQQFLLILRARYWVAILTLLLTVTAVTGYSLMQPKQYTASSSVVVDVKSTDLLSGASMQSAVATGYMATQIDIIRSARVAKEVVAILRLNENPTVIELWKTSTKGKGSVSDWMAAFLQQNMDALPSRESSVINISYTGTDPDFAASIANAFAQAYINVNLNLRVVPARQYAAFFDEQSKGAREKLEVAQKALSDYQQKNGITAVDERLDYETAKLNETSSQLTMLQGVTTESQSKRTAGKADTVIDVMQSPVVSQLKGEIARLEAKLNENSINFGKAHPLTQSAEAELTTLRAKMDAEIRKITSSIDTTYQVSKQREQQLLAALTAQKNRVLQLNKQRDELSVLQRDVESAQRGYDVLVQRATQTTVEGQVNQTNIALLNTAIPPATASKPRVLFNALVSVFLGTLLGIGLAVAIELANRHVRSTEDLVQMLDIPLLGSVDSASGMLKMLPKGAST